MAASPPKTIKFLLCNGLANIAQQNYEQGLCQILDYTQMPLKFLFTTSY